MLNLKCASLFFGAVILTLASGTFGAPVSGRKRAIDAVESRLAKVQDIAASYEMDVNYFRPSAAVRALLRKIDASLVKQHPGAVVGPPLQGEYKYHCRLSFLSGASRTEQLALSQKAVGGPLGVRRIIQTRAPERVEKFIPPRLGMIAGRARPLGSMPLTSALGLRPASYRHWFWIKRRQVAKMAYARITRNRFALTQKTTAGGFTKYYRWVFRTKPALEIVGLEVYHQPGVRHLYMRGKFSNFRVVRGVSLPGRIEDRFFGGSRFPGPTREELLKHIRYTLNSPSNTPSHYLIVWPKGCTVVDERTGSRFQIKSPTVLSDKEIFRRLKKRDGAKAH